MSHCRLSILRNLSRHRHHHHHHHPSITTIQSPNTPQPSLLNNNNNNTHPLLPHQTHRCFTTNPPPPPPPPSTTKPKRDPNQKSPPKTNFATKYLEPAARGDLPRSTPIPKLAVRRPKSNKVHDDNPGPIEVSLLETIVDVEKKAEGGGEAAAAEGDGGKGGKKRTVRRGGGRRVGPPTIPSDTVTGGIQGIIHRASRRRRQFEQDHKSPKSARRGGRGGETTSSTQSSSSKRTTTRLRQITQRLLPPQPSTLSPHLSTNNNRTFLGARSPDVARSFQSQKRRPGGGNNNRRGNNDGTQYDLFGEEIDPEEIADPMLSPLMQFRYKHIPPEGMRRAGRVGDGGRRRPGRDFVERFEVFGFVTGVECPVVVDEEEGGGGKRWGRFKNPLERHMVADTVSKLMDVPVENVFPASMTSAFIGFPKQQQQQQQKTDSDGGKAGDVAAVPAAAGVPIDSDAKAAAEIYLNSERKRLWCDEPLRLDFYNNPNDGDDGDDTTIQTPPLNPTSQEFINSTPSSSSSSSTHTLLHLHNIPSGLPSHTIASTLRPILPIADYTQDICFIDPNHALIRISHDLLPFDSISALLSSLPAAEEEEGGGGKKKKSKKSKKSPLSKLLAKLGKRRIRMQPAHRPIVYAPPQVHGFYQDLQTTTKRGLVVEGDVPSDEFYRNHADVLLLTDLPDDDDDNKEVVVVKVKVEEEEKGINAKTTTMERNLTALVSPYSLDVRDEVGSVEIVRDLDGRSVGRGYVGFDTVQECNGCWEGLTGAGEDNRVHIALSSSSGGGGEDDDATILSPTKIRRVPELPLPIGQHKFGPRTYRTAEELHYELHSKWREYISPSDWEKLHAAGIHETVLADAFYAARIYNPTYSYEDDARVGEKLKEGYVPGQHFEEFVRDYVEALLESVSTVEEPGLLYEGMFFPGEEMDGDLIERERERVEKLAGEEYYG